MDELEALIDRRVAERMDEEQNHLHQQIIELYKERDILKRERDRALYLLVEGGITPILRVNLANHKPIFVIQRLDGEDSTMIDDPEEAIKALLEEKKKAVAEGGSQFA
jgi:hypothetical protein